MALMGLGKLLTRSTQIVITNTETGATATHVIVDNLGPDWPSYSYRGGMGIPGAWRAATMLSDRMGLLPWDAYREVLDRPIQLIQPRPPLLEQPAPPDTRMTTFSSWALDLIWHGNALGIIAARNREGYPTAVYPVPANMVSVSRVAKGSFSTLPIGTIEYFVGGMRDLGPNDMIHIKGPCEPGALRGLGVLETHLATINLATEQIRQAGNIARAGVPTGVLTTQNPDATPEAMAESKAQFLQSQRDRTIAAFGPTVGFQAISWNPDEMQMNESRKFTLTDLENIFGLPIGWLGGQTSSKTYANRVDDAVDLVKFGSLAGYIGRFEAELSRHFPRGTKVMANLDSLLRSDTKTRYEAHALALAGKPWATVDEIRAIEDRAPLTPEQRAELEPAPAVSSASTGAGSTNDPGEGSS